MRSLSAKRRKRRKFRPKKLLKRLTMLAFLTLVVWLVVLAGKGAFSLVASVFNNDYLRTAEATEVSDTGGVTAEAVVLRQETVVLAEKPGFANLVLAEGDTVRTGQLVVELVDKALLSSIENELAKLDAQAAKPDNTDTNLLAEVDEKLAAALDNWQELMDGYRLALKQRDVASYHTLYSGLNAAAKEVSKLQQDRLSVLQSQKSIEEQRAVLESRRQQAVVPVYSPANGRVSFQVDGLEPAASPASLGPTLFADLKQKKVGDYRLVAEASVSAGQPVFKVVTGDETYLLVSLPAGSLSTIQGWSAIAAQVTAESGTTDLPATIHTSERVGQDQCLLEISPAADLVLPRFLTVGLHTVGEVLCQIPEKALVSGESGDQVFLLEGTAVKAQAVAVRKTEGKNVVVTGLSPGLIVVTNTSGLVDGMDVSSRLRK